LRLSLVPSIARCEGEDALATAGETPALLRMSYKELGASFAQQVADPKLKIVFSAT